MSKPPAPTEEPDELVLIPVADLPDSVFERLRAQFGNSPRLDSIEALELIRGEADDLLKRRGASMVKGQEAVFTHMRWLAELALVQDRAESKATARGEPGRDQERRH